VPGVTIVIQVNKRFAYRANAAEVWSNRYALSGAAPADAAAWRTLFDALVVQEKTCYPSNVQVVGGYGYNAVPHKGDHADWGVDLTHAPDTPVNGTLASGSGTVLSGDTAWWIRWKLAKMSSKGKSVYLRKYFHPAISTVGNADQLQAGVQAAGNAFASFMEGSGLPGSRHICADDATNTVSHSVSTYTTVRTLKKRPKRPPTTP
jgi:hypothetical protein